VPKINKKQKKEYTGTGFKQFDHFTQNFKDYQDVIISLHKSAFLHFFILSFSFFSFHKSAFCY